MNGKRDNEIDRLRSEFNQTLRKMVQHQVKEYRLRRFLDINAIFTQEMKRVGVSKKLTEDSLNFVARRVATLPEEVRKIMIEKDKLFDWAALTLYDYAASITGKKKQRPKDFVASVRARLEAICKGG